MDAKGLVALWREGLLAQNVLLGRTEGYKNHPQLLRFKQQAEPSRSLAQYLRAVCDEAERRNYQFKRDKIASPDGAKRMSVSKGQLTYEWRHFLAKIKVRDPKRFAELSSLKDPQPHPLFAVTKGPVAEWEMGRSLPGN